ncbi:MAG TPA: TonB family protein [Pyrinomonadaceae bacterium]|nr:TonB family protein [Pyrinomonadaceae bacterium]
MTPLASAISGALIHFVWQGSIVGVALGLALFGLRRRSPNSRYITSCLALALLAVMPLVTTWLLYSRPAPTRAVTGVAGVSEVISTAAAHLQPRSTLWLNWLRLWALQFWSVGVLLFSVRLILGYKHAFTLRRRGSPSGESITGVVARLTKIMGVPRRVRALMSSMAESPSVIGWLRPVILLPPATLMGLTSLQLEAIIAHEIAHIRRYDYLVNMVQMLVETLLFYHPAVWWISKRIRVERELCCDDLAVRFCGNALRYAKALTRLEKLRLSAPNVAMASTGGPLLYRIQRLVGVKGKEHGASRLPAILAIGIGALCLAWNVTWVRGQDAPGVKVDLGSSSVIHRTPVRYPEPIQKQGITGTVQLEVKLDSAGNVSDARVLSGPEELRKPALESVLNWHFTSDAARGTRQVSISFSDQGQQVQVREGQVPRAQTVPTLEVPVTVLTPEGMKLEEVQIRQREYLVNAARALQEAPEQNDVIARRRELERAIADIQKLLQARNNIGASEVAELQSRLAALQREFNNTPLPVGVGRSGGPGTLRSGGPVGGQRGGGGRGGVRGGPGTLFVGRSVKGISTPGLDDSVSRDLMARLPVREGDTLSQESVEQISSALRSYDEHLRALFFPTEDGQVELRITAPQ